MRIGLRPAAVLATAAAMFLAGVVIASGELGSAGSDNRGPAAGAPSLGVPPVGVAAATTTNTNPTAAFVPYPQDQVYVSITPCRVVDTRVGVPVAKIPANSTRSFKIRGTTGFTAQGGPSTGCGIPESATAVMTSLTASQPDGQGYLRIWPYGQPEPNATVLNYPAAGIGDTTGAVINLGSGSFDVTAKMYNYAAHLVIDVTGYYEPQTHIIVLASGQVWYGLSTHITKLIHSAGTGVYTMIFDRSLTGCDVITTDNGDHTVRADPGWGGTALTVNTYQLVGTSWVHGDQSFQIFITC